MMDALTEADLPEAAARLAAEGWGFAPRELARLLATGPGLSVAARERGRLQGLVMVTRHGDLAWIGNVLVVPEARGKGVGEAMVAEALGRIRAAGIPTTKLCSVLPAITLYERLGFRHEGPVLTFSAFHDRPTHRPAGAEVLLPDDLEELAALDQRAFGADRTALLRQLLRDHPDTGVGVRREERLAGYAFLKPGDAGSEVGPVVLGAPDRALGAMLLDGALGFRLRGEAARVECTVPAGHPFMRALLEERGLAWRDEKRLMAHGAPRAQDWVALAALGGLEKG